MLRNALTIVAALLVLGVLGLLVVQSRSVDEAYYAAYSERVRAVQTTGDDLSAISLGARDALKDARAIPSSLEAALDRIAENSERLGDAAASGELGPELDARIETYDAAVTPYVADARTFMSRQNSLAGALRRLQEESPVVVKDLRRYGLEVQSRNTFALAIDIIEFATGQTRANPARLSERLETIRDNATLEARAPGRLDGFVAAATAVIEERAAAQAALERMNGSSVADELWAVSDAIHAENRRKTGTAERARLLLVVCTVLLVAGTGYAVFRLQSSYRELNTTNAELGRMNSTLEERVASRTEQLSSAYTELKESQVQLVQAEKMSSLGELVAGISHEINTPLWYLISNATVVQERLETVEEFARLAEDMIAAVNSGTDVRQKLARALKDMQRMLGDGLKDDVREALELTTDSIQGLEDLTDLAQSLKDFSRLDRATRGRFDVNEGLDKTLLIAKNKLKSKVTVHRHYGEIPSIFCTPSQVNQVFLNLITNAADAIEESGEIVLKTWCEDDNVLISVADTGKGIPDDVMPRIRDPFFTTKEVGKGTGLGLSIVDRIIGAHHGELRIESEVGKGTIITAVFPVSPPAGEAAAAARDGAGGQGPDATDDEHPDPAGSDTETPLPLPATG